MILLASTSDLLKLVTSAASATDVQVSAMDMNPSDANRPTAYRKNTAVTTATTTTVGESPTSGVLRAVKSVAIRNKGASTQTVQVLHTDGTTEVELYHAVLAPDSALMFHEQAGWWVVDAFGRQALVNVSNSGVSIAGADSVVVLGADITNDNATANTLQDVTGLSFPVLANKMFWFEFVIAFTAAATTTGSRWTISGPASPVKLGYISEYSLSNSTMTRNTLHDYDTPAGSSASSRTTNNFCLIAGIIETPTDGNVIARFASEISASAIVAKASSFVRYRQITA